jgi:hypothetical protein
LVQNSPKAINYKTFKTEFKYEEYLNILEIKDATLFCRFRTTNNKLPIETGRWQNILRAHRKSRLCNRSRIGDGYRDLTIISKQQELFTIYIQIRREVTKD